MAGECPDGWKLVSLRELGEVNRGRSRHRPRYAEHLYGGPYPFIQTGDVKASNGRITSYRQTYSEAGLAQSRLWPEGTMCITIAANIAETGILTFAACFPDSVVGFIAEPDIADVHFVEYMFRFLRSRIQHQATGSVQDNINIETLERLLFPIPPLAAQKVIAAVLGALDDKIELNRRMNATLEAMARALFQSWFVDFDPVRAKLDGRPLADLDPATAVLFPSTFHDSPLGHIPTGWDAVPLYDVAQWVNGAAFTSADFCTAGDGLPVIKIAELKDGISTQTKWCQRDAGPNQTIDTGNLLYSWSGSPDTSLEAFLWSGGPALLNQHIFKVIASTVAEKRFVYYLLQYLRPVLVETARNKQTTGLGHVTVADMKRLLVCRPDKAVLVAFDRNIAPIFDKAFANTLESLTLATLRDTLLPKLLSGELDVSKIPKACTQ
jgi:type I restriction enzyme S subunit